MADRLLISLGNNSSLLDNFTCKLNFEFATKDLGPLSYFLGLEATTTSDGLFISQLKYARDILTRAQLLNNKLILHFTNLLLALSNHFLVVKRILRYVKGTLHFGLTFHPSAAPGALVAYSDVDWAGYPDTRRSTSGYSIYLGGNLVSWSAKKQPTISRSNYESKYHALALIAAKLLWLMHLLGDLKVSIPQRPLLLCAIFLSSNPVSHKRVKHVELDYHFLRELVLTSNLRTQYVPSHFQVADIFTKSVSKPLFELFPSKLHVRSNPKLSLRGGVKDHAKDPQPQFKAFHLHSL
ncbi:uncharacterized mitochondrial protein AtMg00810-like [Vitis riparia]|uniref:uncharacterized mitochondrial protein AtMg00810-like n=1 Tax=Vitis riparia TaxID=96939 RepID=UPI00155B1942|nr:uncharacterized mitochondrial protein AtMg00810-like [Vitis riparia]